MIPIAPPLVGLGRHVRRAMNEGARAVIVPTSGDFEVVRRFLGRSGVLAAATVDAEMYRPRDTR